jgi:SAM-dependent methyltransferase
MISLGAIPDNLYGIDLLPQRIERAQQNNAGLKFYCMDAAQTEFRSEMFDIILIFAVFSSVFADDVCCAIGREVTRLLRHGGAAVWYDIRYGNPWNKNVRPISLADIRRYFPTLRINLRSLTLLPPIARRLPSAYRVLNKLHILRSHWFGLLLKS